MLDCLLFFMAGEVQRLAGDPTLQYLIRLAEGHIDYLCRMPDSVLENIICFLELEDIVRLGITSKRFRKVGCGGMKTTKILGLY